MLKQIVKALQINLPTFPDLQQSQQDLKLFVFKGSLRDGLMFPVTVVLLEWAL